MYTADNPRTASHAVNLMLSFFSH